MNSNGLSLYNVGTSLDLDALNNVAAGNNRNGVDDHEESDDGEEDEIEQRNAELRDLLTNAFDDLIEDDGTDLDETEYGQVGPPADSTSGRSRDYGGDSLFSPLNNVEVTPATQTQSSSRESNNNLSSSALSRLRKKNSVRFSPSQETISYERNWKNSSVEEAENMYLSSGLNTGSELEILYSARGAEIAKLSAELNEARHRVAILEGERKGLSVTVESSNRILRDSRDENACLKDELQALNGRLEQSLKVNGELTAKLEASDNNILSLERQISDMQLFQSSHRDANRQQTIFSDVKARYERDLSTLRDELSRLRRELESRNEALSTMEQKVKDVTEMHERALMERAANLHEFNRALDEQRQLREQRDTLTSSALLEQLAQAKEEIERLRGEQRLSDSMSQLRISAAPNSKDRARERDLERRLQTAESRADSADKALERTEHEKRSVADQLRTLERLRDSMAGEREKLSEELNAVKELYLNVCREKDLLEQQSSSTVTDRDRLVRELQDSEKRAQLELQRGQAESDGKLESAVRQAVARARLEWIAQQTPSNEHVEKSLGELQLLRQSMDALRSSKESLESELLRSKQQAQLERQVLRDKFEADKRLLAKEYDDQLERASRSRTEQEQLISATADAMSRLRLQFEQEKLLIITNYEQQLEQQRLELGGQILAAVTSPEQRSSTPADWRSEMRALRSLLVKAAASPHILAGVDRAVRAMHDSGERDGDQLRLQLNKYKTLKKRVREYQRHVADKLERCRSDSRRSEEYCRQVVEQLLQRVTRELALLQQHKLAVPPPHESSAPPQPESSDFLQTIEGLQLQVSRYIAGLTGSTPAK